MANRDFKQESGKLIKQMREDMGIRQIAIAQEMGIDQGDYSKLENYGIGITDDRWSIVHDKYKSWAKEKIKELEMRIEAQRLFLHRLSNHNQSPN